jgi:hypothetical protein
MNYKYRLKIWHFLKECSRAGLQEDITNGMFRPEESA